MIKITYSASHSDIYAYEYLKGNFDIITFMKYKRHNIAIPGVLLRPGETVIINELSGRRAFWNRDSGCKAITKYAVVDESELKGQGFELYDIIKEDDKQ